MKGRQILMPLSNSWKQQQQHWSTQGQAMVPHLHRLKTDNTQLKKQDMLLHQDFPHKQCSLKWNRSFNLCHGYILNGKSQTRTFSGQSTTKFLLTTICFRCNLSVNSSSSLRNTVYAFFLFNVEVSWLPVTKIQDHWYFLLARIHFAVDIPTSEGW